VTKDNWAGGVQLDGGYNAAEILPGVRVDQPFPHAPVTTQPAEEAYHTVLARAGATLPKRDPVDERVIKMVSSGQITAKAGEELAATLGGVGFRPDVINNITQEVGKGIITDVKQVGGYPEYSGKAYKDSDNDGMPDEWETKHKLNPNDPSDAAGDLNGDGYTNIEKYINGIDPSKKVDWTDLTNNVDSQARAAS